jgi:hypothetical protein
MFMQHAEGSRSQPRSPSRPRLVTSTALATGVALLAGSAQGTASAAVVTTPPPPTPATDALVTPVGIVEPDFGTGKIFLDAEGLEETLACFETIDAEGRPRGDVQLFVDGAPYSSDPDESDPVGLFALLAVLDGTEPANEIYVDALEAGLPEIASFGDSLEGSGISAVVLMIWIPPGSSDSSVTLACTADGDTLTYDFSFWGVVGGENVFNTFSVWYSIPGADAPEHVAKPVAYPMTLSCSPDPVAVGEVVTCVVEKGDPNVKILWRASYNPAFAGQGVKLDAEGNGSFSFVAPAAALGLPVTVELVEWDRTAVVTVGGPVPASIPAGEGQGGLPLGVTLGGLLALGGALRLRRSGAVA